MEVQFALVPVLAMGQPRKLFGKLKQEFDLEAQLIILDEQIC
jgi:hypothetical protein